jgi:hypothetical protein
MTGGFKMDGLGVKQRKTLEEIIRENRNRKSLKTKTQLLLNDIKQSDHKDIMIIVGVWVLWETIEYLFIK